MTTFGLSVVISTIVLAVTIVKPAIFHRQLMSSPIGLSASARRDGIAARNPFGR